MKRGGGKSAQDWVVLIVVAAASAAAAAVDIVVVAVLVLSYVNTAVTLLSIPPLPKIPRHAVRPSLPTRYSICYRNNLRPGTILLL